MIAIDEVDLDTLVARTNERIAAGHSIPITDARGTIQVHPSRITAIRRSGNAIFADIEIGGVKTTVRIL